MPAPRKPLASAYGRWTIVQPESRARINDLSVVLCRCTCGNEAWKGIQHLKEGSTTGCRSCQTYRGNPTRRELAPIYGRWTVVDDSTRPRVLCRCTCGAEYQVYVTQLTRGKSTGCKRCQAAATWQGENNPKWAGGVWEHRVEIKAQLRVERAELKVKLELEARARSAKVEEQMAADREAASRWLALHTSEIPPVLPYLLDRPAFLCYDTTHEVSLWGGTNGCRRVPIPINHWEERG